MPNNESNFIEEGTNCCFHPGTTILVTHSFGERLMTAEFDDALCDQAPWKNPRYDGSKMTGRKINAYYAPDVRINNTLTSSGETIGKFVDVDANVQVWGGDVTYQNLPVITNQTTALYLANTIVGGEENPKYATIKGHSYIGINKILITNPINDTVQVIDATSEPYEEFHRFITNDFPTGNRLIMKILDEEVGQAVPNALQGYHRVRMNKGYLLKAFTYNWAGEYSGSADHDHVLTANNSMYLYKDGFHHDNFYHTGSTGTDPNPSLTITSQSNQLRFRYAVHELFQFANGGTVSDGSGPTFNLRDCGPSFASSSIHSNKFTDQYFSGSFGFIKDAPTGTTNAALLNSSGVGSASRFLAVDSLKHLQQNIEDTLLSQQQKTEIHYTFFQGTKDFAPGFHDERSIGTFELDSQRGQLDIEQGDACAGGIPTSHEVVFKGRDDNRFLPKTDFVYDKIQSAHVQSTSSVTTSVADGCTPPGQGIISTVLNLEKGVNIDRVEDMKVYAQGGALGEIGTDLRTFAESTSGDWGDSLQSSMTADNYYSGSFSYEMSFLDKHHTLIVNCDKNDELENGIGDLGLLLIPEHLVPEVAFNLNYWLDKAGVIPSWGTNTPNSNQNVDPNTPTDGFFT